MQILADSLKIYSGYTFDGISGECQLTGVRLFDSVKPVKPQYVYVTQGELLTNSKGAFVSIGQPEETENPNVIVLPEDTSLHTALVWVQEIFEFYNNWEDSLQETINREGSIEELLELSLHLFGNPIFVHNPEFYLIAMAGESPDPGAWMYDESSGKYIFNNDLINLYKLSPVYLESLTTHGGQIFPEVIRDYPILMINLWRGKVYEGRICASAKNNKILPGQLQLIERLADFVLIALRRQSDRGKYAARMFEVVLTELLDKKPTDEVVIMHHLINQGWKPDDKYMCVKVGVSQRDEYIMSLISACNKIEELIYGSFAFPYQNNIAVIVNLTWGGHTKYNCLSPLGPFLLEGLFKSGSSNVFRDFMQVGDYFQQASAALLIGEQCDETFWSHQFADCVVPYFLRYGCSELPPRLICSEDVIELAAYDEANHTALLETLRVYIANNLNAAQTARALFIHRSTFFYRLDCIKAIIKCNLKDENQRFYLQLSFKLLNIPNDWRDSFTNE